MRNHYILAGFAAYIISYLMLFFLYQRLDLEKLISRRTSIRIALFLIAIMYGIVSFSIINSLTIIGEYRFIISGFFVTGPVTALVVFVLPVNRNKTKF